MEISMNIKSKKSSRRKTLSHYEIDQFLKENDSKENTFHVNNENNVNSKSILELAL